MNNTAITALVFALGTSLWTWWPQSEITESVQVQKAQVLTATGSPVNANAVAGIRVITIDASTRTPLPFEVKRSDGKWVIPSHFNYPADGGTQVGETAGAVLNVPLGPRVTTDKTTHKEYGVIDPLAQNVSEGVGKRVTLSDEGGAVLVDAIVGKKKANTDVFFVRRANEDAVYTAKIQPDNLKATFKDWVETDLLKIAKEDIREATIKDYSVDERTGTVKPRSQVIITRKKGADEWQILPPVPDKIIAEQTIKDFSLEAAGLRLAGVRPYAPAWLQQRGFYMGQDGQELYGNEGEVQIMAKNGLIYRLFFGEIALGDGVDKAAEVSKNTPPDGSTHNRYMAIFVQYAKTFDEGIPDAEFSKPASKDTEQDGGIAIGVAGEPPLGTPDNQAAIDTAIAKGQAHAAKAQARFQQFFYVISDDSFKKLRPARSQFYTDPPTPTK
jgi:hypothetical protein